MAERHFAMRAAMGLALALFSLSPTALAITAIKRVKPGTVLPNHCDPNDRGTRYEEIHYGLMMARAYTCLGIGTRRFLNYGCYCGAGNTGIDTKPADGIDEACRRHDVNLWAICENPAYNESDNQPCNCYHHYVPLGCENGRITFPKGLTACQEACTADLIAMAHQTVPHLAEFRPERLHRWDGFGASSTIPEYCAKTIAPAAETSFAVGPLEIPATEFWPVGRPPQNAR